MRHSGRGAPRVLSVSHLHAYMVRPHNKSRALICIPCTIHHFSFQLTSPFLRKCTRMFSFLGVWPEGLVELDLPRSLTALSLE